MKPDKRFNFHARVTGERQYKFLIVSARPVSLEAVPGTRTLAADVDALRAAVEAHQGRDVATAWGVNEMLVSRLRHALGLGYDYGGDRRSDAWQNEADCPIPPARLYGDGNRQVVVIGCDLAFEMPEAGNILIERDDDARQNFRRWLDNTTISEAAETLGVSRNVIMWCRNFLK